MTTIKRLLRAAGMAVAVAAGPVWANFSGDTVRVAVLTDMTGPYADAAGVGVQLAAELAVADRALDAVPVEVRVHDHAGLSARAAERRARALVDEGADLVVGMTDDGVALGVQRAVGHGKAVTVATGAVSDRLTGEACGSTAFHWAPDLYVLTQVTRDDLAGSGGAGTIFIYGEGRREAIRGSYESGLMQGGQDVTGQVFVTDIRGIGLYAASGMRLITPYYWNADDPSRAFADRFEARQGGRPTYIQAATYSAVAHYLRAVASVGGDDPVNVARRMRALNPDDFYARNGRVRPDGQLVQDLYLARVRSPAQATAAWGYLAIQRTLEGEGLYQPAAESRCEPPGSA